MNNFWFLTQVRYPSPLLPKQERLPIFREASRTNLRIAEGHTISNRVFDLKNEVPLLPYRSLNTDIIDPTLLQFGASNNNPIDQKNGDTRFQMQEVLEQEEPDESGDKITLAGRLQMVIKQLIREEGKNLETPSVRDEVPPELENQYRYKEQEYQAMIQDVKQAKWLDGKEVKENKKHHPRSKTTFEARIQGWSVTQVARTAGNRRDTYYRSPHLRKRLRSIKEVIAYILFEDTQNVRPAKNKLVEEGESHVAQTSAKRRRVSKGANEVTILDSITRDDSNSFYDSNAFREPPQFQILDFLLGKGWMNMSRWPNNQKD